MTKLGVEQFAGYDPAGCGVVPIDCEPNRFLGFDTDGDPACLDVHPPAVLTSSAAPFSWDTATQTGNIPLPGQMTVNVDGTVTFRPGDGSSPTTFQHGWTTVGADGTELVFRYPDGAEVRFDLCMMIGPCIPTIPAPTVVTNPDGSVTIDPGTGAPAVTIPAPGGMETALTATDSDSIDFSTAGTAGHTLTGVVKVDPDSCNRLEANANGLFVQDVHHVMFSINEDAQIGGSVWAENDQTVLVEGYDQIPVTGDLVLTNPSQCLEMDFMLNARAHTVLWGGLDSTTLSYDRTVVLLEIDSGSGFEWISAKQATRVMGSFTGVGLPEGEMWQDYSREHYVSVGPGATLTIPYRLHVYVLNGQGYAVELWRPSFSVIGIAS